MLPCSWFAMIDSENFLYNGWTTRGESSHRSNNIVGTAWEAHRSHRRLYARNRTNTPECETGLNNCLQPRCERALKTYEFNSNRKSTYKYHHRSTQIIIWLLLAIVECHRFRIMSQGEAKVEFFNGHIYHRKSTLKIFIERYLVRRVGFSQWSKIICFKTN